MIYLAGPIDAGNLETERWRPEAAKQLRLREIGSFDPFGAKHVEFMHECDVKIDDFRYIRSFTKIDLAAVEWCWGVLAGLFKDIPIVGTYIEMGIALGQGKPVVIYAPDGDEWFSAFLRGLELPTFTDLDRAVDQMVLSLGLDLNIERTTDVPA